jgi:hypothetical protein
MPNKRKSDIPQPILRGWDNQPIPVPQHQFSDNPMVRQYGSGPLGTECKDCVHLEAYHQSAYWHRCALRKGGDHKVHYPACAKYEREPAGAQN